MADRSQKVPENVQGPFYVDATCIDCELCRETAPRQFVRQDDERYSYVRSQPTTEADEAACIEAMEGCPVEAIGRDGD